jgi:hypothetical protein
LKAGWSLVVNFFKALPGNIADFFKAALNWLVSEGKQILHGLWDGLKQGWQLAVQFFKNIPGWVSNFFSNAINWLVDSGKAIMQGLLNGLEAGWSAVWDWVQNRVDDIKHAFTHPFGIGSPSKWMHWVGTNLMAGLGIGVREGTVAAVGEVSRSVAAMQREFMKLQTGDLSRKVGKALQVQAGDPLTATLRRDVSLAIAAPRSEVRIIREKAHREARRDRLRGTLAFDWKQGNADFEGASDWESRNLR